MKEDWKKQLQQKMADYEESDIDLSWEEIDRALEANRQKAVAAERTKAKTVLLLVRRISAAAAVVLLLAGIGYWMLQRQIPENEEIVEVVMKEGTDYVDRSLISANQGIKQPVPMIPQNHMISQRRGTTEEALSDDSLTTAEEPCSTVKEQQAIDHANDQQTDKTTTEESVSRPIPAPSQQHPMVLYPSGLHKKAPSSDKLTAKVYFSNATASYNNLLSSSQQIPVSPENVNPEEIPPSDGHQNYIDGNVPDTTNSNEDDNEDDTDQQDGKTRQGESQKYRTQETSEATRHHQPVRFGLSLRYRLNDRWSIESGLTYTRLSADFTKTVDDQSVSTEQHLNYIGIPVTASYLLWGNRYLNVYLSAGGMVEKMISGSQTTAGEKSSVSIHPLQFSLSGAVGAEFRFNPQFSLYAEPGIGYWFDNGSSISTYYQDKPFSFSLSLGLRISPW